MGGLEEKISLIAKIYSLDDVLEQNDISEETVLGLLYANGLFDPEDYLFEDVEEGVLSDEF